MRIPVPKHHPVHEPNRCNLEALKPETPKTALYLVLAQGRLTLQVVCLGLAHFRLPVRPPISPSRPTGENPGRPCGGSLGGLPSPRLRRAGGPCQTARWRRIVPTTCGLSTRAVARMGFWHTGQRRGSTYQTLGINWRAAGWAHGAGRFATSAQSSNEMGSNRRSALFSLMIGPTYGLTLAPGQ
jgi:hypothetical protein